MPNLDFILIGLQTWQVQSRHTSLVVGNVIWNPGWRAFAFKPDGWNLDAAALREIAKFIDGQEQVRKQP
jgi:hypothetical protein